jgi:hypothetical protein
MFQCDLCGQIASCTRFAEKIDHCRSSRQYYASALKHSCKPSQGLEIGDCGADNLRCDLTTERAWFCTFWLENS